MKRGTRLLRDSGPLRWLLTVAPLAGAAWLAIGTPSVVLLGALLPALGYVALVLWIGYELRTRMSVTVALFAVGWGAGVAAPAAALVNDLLQAQLGTGGWRLPVTGAPVLEEAAKAAALCALIALWPMEARGLRAGLVIGGLIGIGFSLAENIGYFLLAGVQGGPAGLVRAIAIRGFLEGAVHPLFAASTGAGVGAARADAGRRALPALLGFGAAVAQHALWNGLASPTVNDILCNGTGPSGACRGDPDGVQILAIVPLVVAAALAPGVLTLTALARRAASLGQSTAPVLRS
jgi:protease PrsW